MAITNNEASRDPIYDLPADQRRQLRRAEEEGRHEAERRVAAKEKAREQAEYDAMPEHERRPLNQWRRMIELRKPDAWRPGVKQRLKEWETLAREEDERIDKLMTEKKRRFQLESAPEYQRALDHLERVSKDADPTELEPLARLRGAIEGGDLSGYWRDCQALTEARLERVQQAIADQAARQAPLQEEARVLAQQEQAAAEQLQAAEAEAAQ